MMYWYLYRKQIPKEFCIYFEVEKFVESVLTFTVHRKLNFSECIQL